MDITLARTFLEIVNSGSLLRASERLHVTQTAVSARVRALEDLLGRQLFVRNKAGASLTAAGERFVRHAATLVQVWERARQQVAVPPGRRAVLTIGCETSLWAPLLIDWLQSMRRAEPDLALHAEVAPPDDLLRRVADGTLELAVVYAPQHKPGLRIDLLIEERLVLVTTSPRRAIAPESYVYVDWGPEFAAQHALAFPQWSGAAVSASLGPLGLEYVLAAGGAGYFRQQAVRGHVEAGRLHVVKGAPQFMYPAYAVYAESADASLIGPALAGLRAVSAERTVPATPARRRRGTDRSGNAGRAPAV